MYSVVMYNLPDHCRIHRNCDYERALRWIYQTKALIVTVNVRGVTVCETVNWRSALIAIVRHHARTNNVEVRELV